jgi:hypothetical protein
MGSISKVEISLSEFQEAYEEGAITDCLSVKVGSEWRVYGRALNRLQIVWARMP